MIGPVKFGAAVVVACEDCSGAVSLGLLTPEGGCVALHAVPVCAAFEEKVLESIQREVELIATGPLPEN